MYYIFIKDNKINSYGQCKILNEDMINIEVDEIFYNEFIKNPAMYIWDGLEIVENPNYEAEQAQKEHERIQELFMTRSDFFDATIKAFGTDESDLLQALSGAIMPIGLDDITTKIALNNYKNALHFYRKHTLFEMLSDIEIPVSETLVIRISKEQWDRFFDETNKKNPEAYKELLPVIKEPAEPLEPADEGTET